MIFKIFGKSSEIFGSGRKTSENGSKVIFRYFYDFLQFSENFRKSSEVFGKLWKRFKSNLQMFSWYFKIFGKSSEVFGNLAIFSLVKIWKISYSGPGCTVIWILWVVYFPVKHCCPYNKLNYFTWRTDISPSLVYSPAVFCFWKVQIFISRKEWIESINYLIKISLFLVSIIFFLNLPFRRSARRCKLETWSIK